MDLNRQCRRKAIEASFETAIHDDAPVGVGEHEAGHDLVRGLDLDLGLTPKRLADRRLEADVAAQNGAITLDELEGCRYLVTERRKVGLRFNERREPTPCTFEDSIDEARSGHEHGLHRRVPCAG